MKDDERRKYNLFWYRRYVTFQLWMNLCNLFNKRKAILNMNAVVSVVLKGHTIRPWKSQSGAELRISFWGFQTLLGLWSCFWPCLWLSLKRFLQGSRQRHGTSWQWQDSLTLIFNSDVSIFKTGDKFVENLIFWYKTYLLLQFPSCFDDFSSDFGGNFRQPIRIQYQQNRNNLLRIHATFVKS